MPRPPADTVQVTFRIPSSMLREADEVADVLSKPGMRASRQDAFRAAMARGFEILKAEAAKAPPAPPSSRPRQKAAPKKR
ncbi:MAG: hypothetical protein JST00_31700 [Deltaproteobacteria bacterium]|nr:hypothetical protein [Deltaproteobacteria bacterium]